MNHASFEITEFKAVGEGDEPKGLFAALVSVFGTVDRIGDRVVKGAFAKTLERWRASGRVIPVVFSHLKDDPDAYIGSVDPADVKETDAGLVVAGKLDIASNPKARKIFDLLKSGRLNNWSFAYTVKQERPGRDKARELLELDLFEVGPTLIGAHGDTATLGLKELGLVDDEPVKFDQGVADALVAFDTQVDALIEDKVGRALSAKTEAKIRAVLAGLEDVLASIGEEVPVVEEASVTVTEAKDGAEEAPEVTTPALVAPHLLQLTEAAVFVAERR